MGTIVPIVLVVVGLAVGGWYFFGRTKPPQVEPVFSFHCPSCKRKLKYRARQAGHPGMCPRCKHKMNFPALAPEVGKKPV